MLTAIQLAAALTLQAQTPPPPPPGEQRVFVAVSDGGRGRLDANGDGFVSREEFAAPMNDAFGRLDKDGDGRLSEEELAAGRPPHGGPGGDVVFMRGAPGEGGPHRFEVHTDGEGVNIETRTMVWTSAEGGEGGPVIVRHPGGPGGPGERVMIFTDGDGPGGHPPVVVPGGEGGHRVEIRRVGGPDGEHGDIDANGDGRVTEEEFLAPMRDAFRRMDADNSGALEDGEAGGDRRVHVITRREGGED